MLEQKQISFGDEEDKFININNRRYLGNKYKLLDFINKITDENFEQGLKLYLTGDFEEARKVFTEVIRVNEGDKISIHYLAKCDKNIQRRKNSGGSIEGFTGYII